MTEVNRDKVYGAALALRRNASYLFDAYDEPDEKELKEFLGGILDNIKRISEDIEQELQ